MKKQKKLNKNLFIVVRVVCRSKNYGFEICLKDALFYIYYFLLTKN